MVLSIYAKNSGAGNYEISKFVWSVLVALPLRIDCAAASRGDLSDGISGQLCSREAAPSPKSNGIAANELAAAELAAYEFNELDFNGQFSRTAIVCD